MIKVTLRKKPIADGKKYSLFLDFSQPTLNPKNGKVSRKHYLGLIIHAKPYTAIDKHHNKEIEKQAEMIRQQRQTELNKPEIYTHEERERLKRLELLEGDFIDYYKKQQKKRRGLTQYNWKCALNYLEDFAGFNVKFKDVTEPFLNRFRDYLLNHASLTNNTKSVYLTTVKASVKQAFRDGILDTDLATRLQAIKMEEVKKEFLTLDELHLLAQTPCRDNRVKTASLFSALTGLRFSDINKLTWDEVIEQTDGAVLAFRQKKTSGLMSHPISDQARELLGKRGEGRVFDKLKFLTYQRKMILKDWVLEAGINKPITFHSFRHTFATLQLSAGTDIYTVSKLLGHRDLKTTAIYAKIVDKTKRDAVNRIKLNL